MNYVQHRFKLRKETVRHLQSLVPNFGYNGFGETLFYRTYSRVKADGFNESWNDCVIRVIEGIFSIRKDWYLKNHIVWDENSWQNFAANMSQSMFDMEWLPPGRGLWAMGSDFMFERGAMCLYNCAYTDIGHDLPDAASWIMDSLMCGVGVGFDPERDDLVLKQPVSEVAKYILVDTRESWCESVKLLLESYVEGSETVHFDYQFVRPAGQLIKGFGGISSGPKPLIKLHELIRQVCDKFVKGLIDVVRLKADIVNMIGCCVVAGNVRRSAEIACGEITDHTFLNLKNYKLNPDREAHGWMSNNSVRLRNVDDFIRLGDLATLIRTNGEPGFINMINIRTGRVGKDNEGLRDDRAVGLNPCGEIPLESREVCNLAETFPTVCETHDDWLTACEYATFYCSTVTLLPTHQPSTNKVIARNRRIGVGLVDFTGWKHQEGLHRVTRYLREGYKTIRAVNKLLNSEAGIPDSIRVTTVKPGGTIPKLPGKVSGCGHPTFHYTLRRVRIQQNSPVAGILAFANIPYEKDVYSDNTLVFEFPILQGPARPASDVSLWEQAMNVVLLQREWADNAVSNTLYFRPMWVLIGDYQKTDCEVQIFDEYFTIRTADDSMELDHSNYKLVTEQYSHKLYKFDPKHEEDHIVDVLAHIAPLVKSISLLPHSSKGVYQQMPEEGISEREYEERLTAIQPIDWTKLKFNDLIVESYCTGDNCEITKPA